MAAVFVHGVPDTYRVWKPVFQHLAALRGTDADLAALALPGFDAPVPSGFRATKEEYVAWIVAQLEARGAARMPVDLVGHDWGSLLVTRVASLRPELVRTWAAGSGPVDATYGMASAGHDLQSPGEGEAWMAKLDPVTFAATLKDLEVPANAAEDAARRMDGQVKDCILRLYRSAIHVGEEWQPGLANVRAPGLVFWGERDVACPVRFADRLGTLAHARKVLRLDAGHWVPLQRPGEIARALNEHWNETAKSGGGER